MFVDVAMVVGVPLLPNAEAKLMPAGFDVNSYIIDNGPEAFLSYVFA
mgnify:CR=1 FL=1